MLAELSLFLGSMDIPIEYVPNLTMGIAFISVILTTFFLHLLLRSIFLPVIKKVILQTEFVWDDALIESGLLNRLFQLIPIVILYVVLPVAFIHLKFIDYLLLFLETLMVLWGALVVNSFLTAVLIFSKSLRLYKTVALRSYIQVLRLIVFFISSIVIISMIIGKSPTVLLSGLGALSAVLLLVFKDTIMGFVASMQLTFNKLVETGDWIEVPEYGADGNVVDVSLTTIKVQNWDKTITTIPTYSLVSGSFKNWRGMEESGGRRIKRSVYIDMTSVKFITETIKERLTKLSILSDWMANRLDEIDAYNQGHGIVSDTHLNGRHLTNLGVFRAYLELYLHHHPAIRDDMTFLVRHLEPTEKGVPVEFYVFSKTQDWAAFEAIQADIMDHILAILPQFGLRIYQSPTGYDFKFLAYSKS